MSNKIPIILTVNQRKVELKVEPRHIKVDLLRNYLKLR